MQDIRYFWSFNGEELAKEISDYAKDNDCHVDNIVYAISQHETHNAIVTMTKNTHV